MKNLDFASATRAEFIRSVDAPSAAKQFVIDCGYGAFGLVVSFAIIYARS